MSLQNTFAKPILPVLLATALLAGCGPAESDTSPNGNASAGTEQTDEAEAADPHDIPLTDADREKLKSDNADYAVAIASIQSYRDTIRDETTGGTPAKAHRALDNLDYVLQLLPEIAQNSGVPKSNWEEVNVTAQALRDSFDKVHTKIDAGEQPDYQSVAAEIDEAVTTIAAIKPE